MDKRLETCAKLCKGNVICDVGTDHAYLPCYMIENKMCIKAYACDVAQKPLEYAKKHILERGLSASVTAILSDGLDSVDKNDITDVIMAGMGGELISALVDKCEWLRNSDITLVLQPMTKWDTLRKWLYDNQFAVKKEIACHEGRFVYSVMQVKYIGRQPDYCCDGKYLYYGFVDNTYPEGIEYLKRQSERLLTAAAGMMKSDNKKAEGKELEALGRLFNY